jgi:hypothetical protein
MADGGVVRRANVEIYRGRVGGISSSVDQRIEFEGEGFANLAVGDIDGDGYGDLALGEPFANGGAGRLTLYRGQEGALMPMGEVRPPDASPLSFGMRVQSVGDLNGDGYGDVAVLSPSATPLAPGVGRVHVFYGSASGIAATPARTIAAPTDLATLSIAGCDVNGDGFSDLALSLVATSGATFGQLLLFLGSTSGIPAVASQTLSSPERSRGFGMPITCVGDVDGDGRNELAVSDGSASDSGRVYVFAGHETGLRTPAATTVDPSQTGTVTQWRVRAYAAADTSGDGVPDLLLDTASSVPTSAPAPSILAGPTFSFSERAGVSGIIAARALSALLINAAAIVGDVDGDQRFDAVFVRNQEPSGTMELVVRHGTAAGLDPVRGVRIAGVGSNGWGHVVGF